MYGMRVLCAQDVRTPWICGGDTTSGRFTSGVTRMIADVKPAVVAKLQNYEGILRRSSSASTACEWEMRTPWICGGDTTSGRLANCVSPAHEKPSPLEQTAHLIITGMIPHIFFIATISFTTTTHRRRPTSP